MIKIENEIIFNYLDGLRESGKTNMLGAGAYIVESFGVSEKEAREFLGEWMRTFDDRHPRREVR